MTEPSAPKGTAIWTLIESLDRLGVEYAGSISAGEGGKWYCPNPDHEDEHASFDVHVGRNGKPIMTCTPCREAMGQEDFIDLLRSHGVKWRGAPTTTDQVDFGPAAVVTRPSTEKGSKGEVALTCVYTYKHADGTDNFKVKRYDPVEGSEARKHFRPEAFVLGSGWKRGRGALDNVERTPLYLERFEGWANGPIYLVEGEKACNALVEAGKAATTFHGGTAGKTETDWPTLYGFDRFSEVRLWPDADEAGVERMNALASDLKKAGVKVSFWGRTDVEPKDDAFDVLARKQVPARLADGDLDVLAEMHRKPTKREKAQKPASEPLTVGGKVLVSAEGWEPVGEALEQPTETDEAERSMNEPYGCAATQEPYAFALEMIERHWMIDGVLTLRFRHDDETFWLWHERQRRYDHLIEEDLKAIIKRKLHGAWETFFDKEEGPSGRLVKVTDRLVNELVKHLRSLTLTSEYGAGALLPSVGGIPFMNGWLDAETGVLVPSGPERDIRWVVQADYEPDAKCPEWVKFLDSLGWTQGTDERRLVRQAMGYFLTGRKDLEKALLMKGPTRCGKGTIIRVLHALMGDGAVGTSLESIMANFGLQNFIGKGLATIGDARFGRSDKGLNARLLSLTSNDELPVDVKYGTPLSINLPIRLVIATNEMPNFIEASDALARRFIVLTFTESFLGREDRGLMGRLRGELPGIARWALGGLRDLDKEGRFTETKSGQEMQRQMIEESSFVRVFINDNCTIEPGAKVSNDDLYAQYAIWATQQGMPVLNSVHFGRQLLDAFPGTITSGKVGKARGKIGVRLGKS